MERERLVENKVGQTAFHESGHSIVARALKGIVSRESVRPEGNVAGYIIASFEHFPFQEKIFRLMATLAGGYVAEERIGKSDHRGTGSDMGNLDFLADYASRILYEGKVTAEHLKSRSFSLARSILSNFGLLEERAWNLYQRQVIV